MKYIHLVFCFLFALNFKASATEQLEASVDRSQISVNETLNLRVTANIKLDFSFGGLMNFGRNQIESPNLEELKENFDVLDSQQNYSMRSINGESTSQIVWNYVLAPKSSGKLTIPSLKYKDLESAPITINVLKKSDVASTENPPDAFIEINIDNKQPHVQQQVMLTISLFTKGRISNGTLTEPESNDAIIEPLGDDKKFYRMAYNQRYDVVERQYLIFPQKSGDMEIPGIVFNGQLIDSYNRRRLRLRTSSEDINIHVLPPAESFKGTDWLPALSLHIEEKWNEEPQEIRLGDALTRTIKLNALGLLGSALPPVNPPSSELFKTYTDKPVIESVQHSSGVQSSRTESVTYVAVKPGEAILPALEILWWDTANNVQRIARLPEKRINIVGDLTNQSAIPQIENDESESNQKASVAALINQELPESFEDTATKKHINESPSHLSLSIIILLCLGWATSVWLILSKLRYQQALINKLNLDGKPLESQPKNLDKEWLSAIKNASPELPKITLEWFNENNSAHFDNIESLKFASPAIYEQIQNFEKYLYGDASSNNFDAQKLQLEATALIKKNKRAAQKSNHTYDLKPFYPE